MLQAAFTGNTVTGKQQLSQVSCNPCSDSHTGIRGDRHQLHHLFRRKGDTQDVLGRAKEFVPDLCSAGG